MTRGYQLGFSDDNKSVYDVSGRERKARTMLAVLDDYMVTPLAECRLLNVGGSAGIIDNYLADNFKQVVGMDIDIDAIIHANREFKKENLVFQVADAMKLPYPAESFDVVVCSHVYEHVPDADRMFEEIFRVLSKEGVCYFSAGNRLMYNEPHHNLPLLSVLPRPMAHIYMRLAGKGKYYYEKHLSYWGLKALVKRFKCVDYTKRLVLESEKFSTDYMLRPGSLKRKSAKIIVKYLYWACPGYIWLLKKK